MQILPLQLCLGQRGAGGSLKGRANSRPSAAALSTCRAALSLRGTQGQRQMVMSTDNVPLQYLKVMRGWQTVTISFEAELFPLAWEQGEGTC